MSCVERLTVSFVLQSSVAVTPGSISCPSGPTQFSWLMKPHKKSCFWSSSSSHHSSSPRCPCPHSSLTNTDTQERGTLCLGLHIEGIFTETGSEFINRVTSYTRLFFFLYCNSSLKLIFQGISSSIASEHSKSQETK